VESSFELGSCLPRLLCGMALGNAEHRDGGRGDHLRAGGVGRLAAVGGDGVGDCDVGAVRAKRKPGSGPGHRDTGVTRLCRIGVPAQITER
jgi:hypothetical protein